MVFVFCFFLPKATAQSPGYIVTSEKGYYQGSISFNKRYPTLIEFSVGNEPSQIFTAQNIEEFGFTNGDKYQSVLIRNEEIPVYYFLKVLEEGPLTLLQAHKIRKHYYFRYDTIFIELDKSNYQEKIQEFEAIIRHEGIRLRLLNFNQSSIKNYVRKFNQTHKDEPGREIFIGGILRFGARLRGFREDRDQENIVEKEKKKFGFTIGIVNSGLRVPDNFILGTAPNPHGAFNIRTFGGLVGGTMSMPIISDFWLAMDINYLREVFNKEQTFNGSQNILTKHDIQFNYHTLNFNIGLRKYFKNIRTNANFDSNSRDFYVGINSGFYFLMGNHRVFMTRTTSASNSSNPDLLNYNLFQYNDLGPFPRIYYGTTINLGLADYKILGRSFQVELGISLLFPGKDESEAWRQRNYFITPDKIDMNRLFLTFSTKI